MPTVDSEVAANLVTNNTKLHTSNYWSLLACLVKELEKSSSESTTNIEMAMSAIAKGIPPNKVAAHWAQKLQNRKSRRFAFLDSGVTSGAAPEEDAPDLDNTGQPSQKTFMFLDGRTGKATKKMLLKHNLHLAAREMNIMPGLHLALVSIPKLVDAGYTTVFNKNGAAIYDEKTTTFTATNPPALESERCKHTGMWTLNLNPETTISNQEVPTAPPETLNIIFDLPSSRKTFLWYHTSGGFPPKDVRFPTVQDAYLYASMIFERDVYLNASMIFERDAYLYASMIFKQK
jgi:hypothetical protein